MTNSLIILILMELYEFKNLLYNDWAHTSESSHRSLGN